MIGTAISQVGSDGLGGINSESGIGTASNLWCGEFRGAANSGEGSLLISSVSGIGTATSSGNKFLFTRVFLGFFFGGSGGGAEGSGVETIDSTEFVSSCSSGIVGRLFLVEVELLGIDVGDVDVEAAGKFPAESFSGASCSAGTMSIKKSNISL